MGMSMVGSSNVGARALSPCDSAIQSRSLPGAHPRAPPVPAVSPTYNLVGGAHPRELQGSMEINMNGSPNNLCARLQSQSTSHNKSHVRPLLTFDNLLKPFGLAGVLTVVLATGVQADDQPSDFKVECAITYEFVVKKVTDPQNPGGAKVLPTDFHVYFGPEGLNESFLVEQNSFKFTNSQGQGFEGPSADKIIPKGSGVGRGFGIIGAEGATFIFKVKIRLKYNNKIELSGLWTVNDVPSDKIPAVKFRAGKKVVDDYWLIINDADYQLGVVNVGILNNASDVPFDQFEPDTHGLTGFTTVSDFALDPFDPGCQSLGCSDRMLFDTIECCSDEFIPGFFSYVKGQIVDPAAPEDVLAEFLMKHEAPLPGACCLPNATCIVEDPQVCVSMGGIFQGEGTTCEEVECPEPIPTVSEWGLIGLTLLLLTAGTIILAKRRRAAAM